jgi:hypothetical protein
VDPVNTNTNGSQRASETTSPSVHWPLQSQGASAEERLGALMETVRNWDWRALSPDLSPAPGPLPAPTVADLLPVPPSVTNIKEAPGSFVNRESGPATASTATEQVVLEPTPRHARVESTPAATEQVLLEATPRQAIVTPRQAIVESTPAGSPEDKAPPVAPVPSKVEASISAPQPPASPSSPQVQAESAPVSGRPARFSQLKLFSLYFVSAVGVLLIIGALRFFA